MPTASTLSGYTFSNWGPLTTTFTAPTSCATLTSNVGAGESIPFPRLYYRAECSPEYDWSCVPTGTITSLPPQYTSLDLNPQNEMHKNYFSPGLYCPSGWATVGLASRDGDKPVTSSGVVSPIAPVPTHFYFPFANTPENVFVQMLEPNETAVWCCPSSMTANTLVGCYSALPDYEISTVCEMVMPSYNIDIESATVLLDGTTVSGPMMSLTGTHPVSTRHHNVPDDYEFVGLTIAPFVTIVHRSGDLPASTTVHQSSDLPTSPSTVKTNGVSSNMGNFGGVLLVWTAMTVGVAKAMFW
ncbi:hypothetical protein N7517_008306 [Penicillium concentricum]|uniref:Uncharacterized protein n=1 Tax=Penicillium concentricum TaxID=293559 RepID=A0A9W9RS73_9EURO|nr:uncharacterized protein N7517_008306 [Penicillium concentricum]KAJ5365420.1 hypothetical protein N7517_008306 [Penicillium concentricum]